MIDHRQRDGANWIRLDRPQRGNALDPDTLEELSAAIDATTSDARAVVVTGTGSAFCAGADVSAAAGMIDDDAALLAYMDRARSVLDELRHLPVPTIAAVNGVTLAGGLELLLACDVVIAAADAPIGDGHTRHGFVPAWGATAHLPRRIPADLAMLMFATGASWPAAELVGTGLVTEAVEPARLEDRVRELVGQIATTSNTAVAEVVRLVRARAGRSTHDALRAEREAFSRQCHDASLRAGLARFAPPAE